MKIGFQWCSFVFSFAIKLEEFIKKDPGIKAPRTTTDKDVSMIPRDFFYQGYLTKAWYIIRKFSVHRYEVHEDTCVARSLLSINVSYIAHGECLPGENEGLDSTLLVTITQPPFHEVSLMFAFSRPSRQSRPVHTCPIPRLVSTRKSELSIRTTRTGRPMYSRVVPRPVPVV